MNKLKVFLLNLSILVLAGCHTHKHGTETTISDNEDFFGAYTIVNSDYGTKTIVTITDGKRKMVTNALPNHSTGDFPNEGNPNTISAQKRSYEFTLDPKYTGKAKWAREPGVALNGVKFEPQTSEVIQ